jgi:hypothetical protein
VVDQGAINVNEIQPLKNPQDTSKNSFEVKTSYSYYPDSSKQQNKVGFDTVTSTYDVRGCVKTLVDSNGLQHNL